MLLRLQHILIALLTCINLSAQLELRLDKNFAFSSDVLNATLTSKTITTKTASFLVLRDTDGTVLKMVASSFIEGESRFSFTVPELAADGWYELSGFTYDDGLKVLDLVQTIVPMYQLPAGQAEFTAYEPELNLPSCSAEELADATFVTSIMAHAISKKITLENSQQALNTGTAVAESPMRLEIDVVEGEQAYYGFYSPRVSTIQGLRKLEDNVYTMKVSDVFAPVEGQVLGTDAFGKIKMYNAMRLELEFDIPSLPNEGKNLPMFTELSEYASRLRKQAITQRLYEQYYYYPAAESLLSASNSYLKEDFILFNDTEEFVDEVVPLIKYKKKSKSIEVLDENKKWLKGQALVLVDNQILQEKELNKHVNYSKLRKVEVYRDKATLRDAFGAFGRNGVVIFETEDISPEQAVRYDPGNVMKLRLATNGGPQFLSGAFADETAASEYADAQVVLKSRNEGEACLLERKKAD